MGACEGLEHVVMRVDETWDHNVARSVEHAVHAGHRLSAASDKLDDSAVIRYNAATGALRKDCDRVLNPHSHRRAPHDLSEKVASVGLRVNLRADWEPSISARFARVANPLIFEPIDLP
jgi:hypothetical protein